MIYPSSLGILYRSLKASGLFPIDPEVLDRRIVGQLAESRRKRGRAPRSPSPDARHELMRRTIVEILSPKGDEAPTRRGPRKRVQANFGEVLTRPEAIERLRLEAEERQIRDAAKKDAVRKLKEAKKAVRDAEKDRKKALKKAEKEKKDKEKEKKKEDKKKDKVAKSVAKKNTKKKTTSKDLMKQFNKVLNYNPSSSSETEDDQDDRELLRKDRNNSWSSKSSEVNTSDLIPSDHNDDEFSENEPGPSTATATAKRQANTPLYQVTKKSAKSKSTTRTVHEQWVVTVNDDNEMNEQENEVPTRNDDNEMNDQENIVTRLNENEVTKDDVNVVEIEIDGKTELIKENVTYVIVEYEGEKWPGLVTAIKKKGYEVTCMSPAGIGQWKWPEKPDKANYQAEDLVAVIETPKLWNSRNVYIVPAMDDFW